MKYFKVKVYNGDELVYEDVVRSNQSRTAITNVLTNKYRKDCTNASAAEVSLAEHTECHKQKEESE